MEGFLGITLAIVWMVLAGVVGAVITVFLIRRDQKTLIRQVEALQRQLDRLDRAWRGAPPAAGATPSTTAAVAAAAAPSTPATAAAPLTPAVAPPPPPPTPTPAATAAAPPRPPPLPAPVAAAAPAAPRPAPAPLPASPAPAAAMAAAMPPSAKAPAAPAEPSEPGPIQRFEAAAVAVLTRAWNWLIVGEEYRDPRRSLEYSVATTWGIRLAIALIVTGIAFGLRLSFERGLIGPFGRVSLGVLAGIGMVGGGLVLLGRRYHIIGQGFLGGGLATLYLTAYAAHHLYHLVSVWGAFGCMAVVTAAAGVISVSVPSLLTAILGIIGGYLTPFVLTGSTAGYGALFGYLIILGIGVLIVGHFRYWVLLNYLGMAFAYAHVFRALDRAPYHPEDLWQVLPPLALLFLLYTLVAIIHNLVRRRPATLIEALGLIVNSSLFFWLARDLITQSYPREAVAVLTVALAALYVGMVYVLLARRQNDRNLLLPLLALAGTYTALTMPLVLSREWLTTSWAVQAFVMLWLARRLGSRFLAGLAYVLYAVVIWRLFGLDLRTAFHRLPGDLTWGVYARSLAERLVAFGVPIAALLGAWRLNAAGSAGAATPQERPGPAEGAPAGRAPWALGAFLAVAVLAGFVYLQLEVHRFCGVMYEPLRPPALTFLWIVLAAGLLIAAARARARALLTVVFWTVICLAIGKLVVVDLQVWGFSPERLSFSLAKGYSWAVAAMRALDFVVVVLFAAWAARRLHREGRGGAVLFAVMGLLVLFFYLTAEVNTLVRHFVPGLRAGGISLLWSVYALALVIAGIRRASRPLRLAGLLLFAVVGLKVFFVDLSHLEPLYRMLALIAMGLITLGGTVLYLRNAERFQPDTDEEKAS